MIYITGDTHSDFRRFGKSIFPEQKEMTKEITVLLPEISAEFGMESMIRLIGKRRTTFWMGTENGFCHNTLCAVLYTGISGIS